MTDSTKVQGWLDVFGHWDPTLAFVLLGAILPMVFVWRFAEGRKPRLGGNFPPAPSTRLDRNLIAGSVIFGAGWGLAGLCPGPAIASLSYGGTGGVIFVLAMLAGMSVVKPVRGWVDARATSA